MSLHEGRKYISLSWTTPSGKAHTIQAIPKKMLMHFSAGIRHLLSGLPQKRNASALDFGSVALDANAMGFVLGQLQWSWATGTGLNFECRESNTLERRLQTYKALQVLDVFPFHKKLHRALLNDVYRMTASTSVIREICTNHADDWGFTSSLLANMALQVSLGSCRGDVWDCFQDSVAQDEALKQRFQSVLVTVRNAKNRAQKNAYVGQSRAAPKLAQKSSQEPVQVAETEEAECFLSSESDLFEDEEDDDE